MKNRTSSEGQAMIEFLLGLVAILILLLGINQIATIVYYDFTTIYSAREQVADSLMDQVAGSAGSSSDYDFSSLSTLFTTALNPSDDLHSQLDAYPGDRDNQFSFLWGDSDPLQDMVGAEKGSSSPVTSSLMQEILGRSSITINNAVYMPPWEDLLESGGVN
ncbi:hypothetical protein P4C99_19185 [Pontiellaceae bacterium B1224]|nr:hypothetical protein [Pontiellaceae bacterium B1224]